MDRGNEVRQTLMRSAIRVVSVQGIQSATTKAISVEAGLSEVYIYRYFQSKDDLLKQTFDSLDKELMYLMMTSLKNVKAQNTDTNVKTALKNIYHDFWRFTLGDKDKCSFFIQYYYSSYYSTHSEIERKAIYQPLLDVVSSAFSNDVDAWIELNHMYDIVFPKLLRVIRGTIPDNADTEEAVYREVQLIEERNMLWNRTL